MDTTRSNLSPWSVRMQVDVEWLIGFDSDYLVMYDYREGWSGDR